MSELDAIRRLSRAMAAACLGAMLLLPLFLTVAWTLLPELRQQWPAYGGLPIPADPPSELMLVGWLVLLVPLAILIRGLQSLRRLFQLYAAGTVFSPEAAARLSGFARAVLLWALVQPLANAAAGTLLTLANPPGQRALAISLGTGELGAVAVGLILLVIAKVMREAARLADENAAFV